MVLRTLIVLIGLIVVNFCVAQNDKPEREAFTLKLPVDGKQYYEQEVKKSPYFVKDNILQIYPGEKLFIEVELKKKTITSMKIVKENLNPDKTIEVKFTQISKDAEHESMMLKIVNPFKNDLEYKAMMFVVGHENWIDTNVLPVRAGLTAFETWPDVIITLVLSDWQLK